MGANLDVSLLPLPFRPAYCCARFLMNGIVYGYKDGYLATGKRDKMQRTASKREDKAERKKAKAKAKARRRSGRSMETLR